MTIIHDIPTQAGTNEPTPERPYLVETNTGIGRVEGFYGDSDKQLLAALLPIREAFVIDKMHWRGNDHKEGDPYDFTSDTLQLALYTGEGESGKILSSLRLTKVPSFEESLSLNMLTLNPDMHDEARAFGSLHDLDATAQRGNLYDLTRLVSNIDENDNLDNVLGSFMELFGAAAGTVRHNTDPENHEDIKWIFVVTGTIKNVLKEQGVEMTRLTNGFVTPEDETNGFKSHFYLVHQESAIRAVEANKALLQNSYPHLRDGLAKTGWNL